MSCQLSAVSHQLREGGCAMLCCGNGIVKPAPRISPESVPAAPVGHYSAPAGTEWAVGVRFVRIGRSRRMNNAIPFHTESFDNRGQETFGRASAGSETRAQRGRIGYPRGEVRQQICRTIDNGVPTAASGTGLTADDGGGRARTGSGRLNSSVRGQVTILRERS